MFLRWDCVKVYIMLDSHRDEVIKGGNWSGSLEVADEYRSM